ncbi:MAG: nonstructural protein [Microvirus sp.]|nr:MAG: nonstructural protein [Microvirus sp.]
MFYQLCSLFDSKAETFSPVQAVPNVNAFVRMLGDMINSPPKPDSEAWVLHPEDFSLYVLGTQSDADGTLFSNINKFCELHSLVRS